MPKMVFCLNLADALPLDLAGGCAVDRMHNGSLRWQSVGIPNQSKRGILSFCKVRGMEEAQKRCPGQLGVANISRIV